MPRLAFSTFRLRGSLIETLWSAGPTGAFVTVTLSRGRLPAKPRPDASALSGQPITVTGADTFVVAPFWPPKVPSTVR